MKLKYALAAVTVAGLAAPAFAADVTPQRLLNAKNEPQNWLLPYGSYDSHNGSSLSQINRGNVANLKVKFLHSIGGTKTASRTGQPPTLESTPVVDDGFMYVHNGWSQVMKIDVRSGARGQAIWIHDPELEAGGAMRGSVALLGKYLYHNVGGPKPRLFKVDANTGETVWEVSTQPTAAEGSTANNSHSVQPMALKNQLMLAATGPRDFIAAHDANDGKLKWRFWTVPGPGEFGHETWADNWDAWKTGGVAVWTQGSYDPETNLAIYGTGEAKPWGDPEFRPGDNLFASSAVALDADTGKLKWHFQEIPSDTHDRDAVNPRMLYDIVVNGETRKVQGNFSRTGYYFTLDRTNGQYLFAQPYTLVNWTKGLDPKTGKPVEYDPKQLVQDYGPGKSLRAGRPETSQNVCPNWIGSPTMVPPHYDTRRQTAYIGAATGCFSESLPKGYERTKDGNRSFPGLELTSIGRQQGRIVAVDATTGKVKAETTYPWALYGGTLGTAGDLLIVSAIDGTVMALDKDTLGELWRFNVGTSISSPAITYAVDGKQYIAVAVGGGLYRPDDFNTRELLTLQRNSQIVVFGL